MALDFDKWLGGEYSWDGAPPVTEQDLEALLAWAPAELPRNFVNLLRRSDGGRALLADDRCVRIWSARMVIESNRDSAIPGFIGFADDGGPTFFAFETRHDFPYAVHACTFSPLQTGEQVSKCFGSFFNLARKGAP